MRIAGSVDSGWRSRLASEDSFGPAVALGKFDALHRGHQRLAITAVHLGGTPYLISFGGMAEVLGWDPRLPLVAPCDRERVLSSWKKDCLGTVPKEHIIPFSEVRKMSPEEFVDLLDVDLGVKGVVVGSNYRFGYKAAGTAEILKSLGAERGIKVKIVNLIEKDSIDSHGLGEVVSSSKIRDGLKEGDMTVVEQCLGRKYRLVATVQKDDIAAHRKICCDCFLNQYPMCGNYTVSVSFADVNTLQVLGEPVATTMTLDEDGFSFQPLKGNTLDAFDDYTYYCFIDF